MSEAIYYTVEKAGEGVFKEKMSKFISFARHVTDAESAREVIKEFQNSYHDARHVCWAYMIGPARQEWQLNDNGEPSGTAGKPILGQINSKGLTDVVVVVVRYFGGIKLGTPGLIAAYREAARLALEDAGIKEMVEMAPRVIHFPYIVMENVMKILKRGGVEVLDREFDNVCTFRLEIRKDCVEEIDTALQKVEGLYAD